MKLLKDFHYEIKNARTHVCHLHFQKLEQKLELLTDHLTIEILLDHVNIMYDYQIQLKFLKINSTFAD
jgi:hypothetical protein